MSGKLEGDKMDIKEVSEKSAEIRKLYHALEEKHHGSKWSVEEDASAFLTDAGLVGRLTMDHEGRWPSSDAEMLPTKNMSVRWWI